MVQEIRSILRRMIPRRLQLWLSLARAHRVNENIIIYHFLQQVGSSRTMIDVGASHGSFLLPFAENGWTVHAFEPNPESRAVLARRVSKYPAVTVHANAVSDKNTEKVLFYGSRLTSGIGTLTPFDPSHEPMGDVAVCRLDNCLPANMPVDYMKVDTEGYDLFVLKGYPWTSSRPTVILCEFENKKSVPLGYTFHDLAKFLVDLNYSVLVSEYVPIQDYSVDPLWRQFRPYPCELVDDQDSGNLIAVKDPQLFAQFLKIAGAFERRYAQKGLCAKPSV